MKSLINVVPTQQMTEVPHRVEIEVRVGFALL